jgi:hypothetical protein
MSLFAILLVYMVFFLQILLYVLANFHEFVQKKIKQYFLHNYIMISHRKVVL